MKRLYTLVILFAVVSVAIIHCACASASGVSVSHILKYNSTTDPILSVAVDSIDYRPDLTRVYCRLIGRPHTSNRIDAASLLSGKTSLSATDIDGVDFKRYFQWEDEGQIGVEIDFPSMKSIKAGQLVITTPRGESVTILKLK